MELTRSQLEDAIASLRRTAQDVRASGQRGWLTTAMGLERVLREREADLAGLDAGPTAAPHV